MGSLIWVIIGGAVFGLANVIPGVSGGTMAVVMGFYDRLIDSIGNFFEDWKKNLKFLLPFVLGAGIAILLFSRLVEILLSSYQMQVNFFFLGLILGSIPMIWRKASEDKVKITGVIGLLAGLAVMAFMTFLSPEESTAAYDTLTAGRFVQLLLSGAFAAMTMIIPGVSGSMLLLITGVYYTVIGSVSQLNIPLLLPIGIGIVIGFLAGTKLISVCLKRFSSVTYCTILGLVIGSVLPVFQETRLIAQIRDGEFQISVGFVAAVLFLCAGAVLAYLMALQKRGETAGRQEAT